MPRIEPIPLDELNPTSRQIIEEGFGDGLYSTQVPLRIFAYKSAQLAGVHQARTGGGKGSLLGGRILELIRIRSAQLGECQPCMQSRKHDSITDEDVACLLAPVRGDLTDQEAMAVEFLDLLSADHHAIDAEFYERMSKVFTAAQIVELGFVCANTMGLHRFLHTLDLFGTDPPVIPYDPAQVDTAMADPSTAATPDGAEASQVAR
jgi:alkylhydroperoxidase family enzyme